MSETKDSPSLNGDKSKKRLFPGDSCDGPRILVDDGNRSCSWALLRARDNPEASELSISKVSARANGGKPTSFLSCNSLRVMSDGFQETTAERTGWFREMTREVASALITRRAKIIHVSVRQHAYPPRKRPSHSRITIAE